MIAHTPGPWEWANGEVFAEPSNDSICVVLQKAPHADANACLIAAAPEMLAVLRRTEDWLSRGASGPLLEGIRAVIARAERKENGQ
jgi:hypothetical protein